jgi:glutamate synthase domain-containing protein 3
MTGGSVLVLGDVGANFGAGMTGGSAFVLDSAGTLSGALNHESVLATPLSADDEKLLLQLLEMHYAATESPRALRLLIGFEQAALDFRAVRPRRADIFQTRWEAAIDGMKVRAIS